MRNTHLLRPTAWLLVLLSLLPMILTGCQSAPSSQANLPPVDDTRGGTVVPANAPAPASTKRPGMSNATKAAVVLVGAAALYYMYKKHRDAQNQPTTVQYYLSKNGRVYYRDAQKRAHWVTPPPQGIQVPADEAQEFQDYQGYNQQATGKDLVGLGSD